MSTLAAGSLASSWTLTRAVPVLVAILLGYLYLGSRFVVAIDDQVNKCLEPAKTFYVIDRHDDRALRGELIAFTAGTRFQALPHGLAVHQRLELPIIKRVVGLPGDQVEVTAEDTRVNGVRVGEGLALAATLQRDPETFVRTLTLGPEEYWIMGDTHDSFDARYWGVTGSHEIIGRAYGLY